METTATTIECGSCGESNATAAKFCEACGQSLYEPCYQCDTPVLLTQKFCGSCGTELDVALAKRGQQYETWLADAVKAAQSHEYDRSIGLLNRVAQVKDYRFAKTIDSAKNAIEKVTDLQKRTQATVDKAVELAREALDRDDKAEVVRQLQNLPPILLSVDANEMLNRVRAFTNQIKSLDGELKEAIAQKNWQLTGNIVSQLLELAPNDKRILKLASQVSEKLIAKAQILTQKRNYSAALGNLTAVPSSHRDQAYQDFNNRVLDLQWLSEQLDSEPYASSCLGNIAMRFSKEQPEDTEAKTVVKQIGERLKSDDCLPGTHLPVWKSNTKSWIGGEARILSRPSGIQWKENSTFESAPGRFTLAIGLALQGLGKTRIKEDFAPKKKKLLSAFSKRAERCWGIDIGTASIKAVLLETSEAGIELVESFVHDFESPTSRSGFASSELEAIRPAVKEFLNTHDLGDTPVWTNLSGSHVICRFVRLPPVKEKQAALLLNQEIKQKIPIESKDLSVVSWMHGELSEDLVGRPATIAAARRKAVEDRVALLKVLGLEVAGMQADPIALANFAAHEFAALWLVPEETKPKSKLKGKKRKGTPKETEVSSSATADLMKQSIAIVDCGATKTNLVLVSGEGQWSCSIDAGGETFTGLLARSAKVPHDKAEAIKRNPASLDHPSIEYAAIEQRLAQTRARLSTAHAEALKQNNRFEVQQSWVMGGGALTYRWLHSVMLDSSNCE